LAPVAGSEGESAVDWRRISSLSGWWLSLAACWLFEYNAIDQSQIRCDALGLSNKQIQSFFRYVPAPCAKLFSVKAQARSGDAGGLAQDDLLEHG
jgi:hypothetical protein